MIVFTQNFAGIAQKCFLQKLTVLFNILYHKEAFTFAEHCVWGGQLALLQGYWKL